MDIGHLSNAIELFEKAEKKYQKVQEIRGDKLILGESEEEKLLKLEWRLRLDEVNLSVQRVLFEFNRSLYNFRERLLDVGLIVPADLKELLSEEFIWNDDEANNEDVDCEEGGGENVHDRGGEAEAKCED
jgi:hypothetical protein